MTECVYDQQLTTFTNKSIVEVSSYEVIPLLESGKALLEKLNQQNGLGFDDWDIDFYYNMFANTLKRNPTDVEIFDLAQSNSEHSRHWYFGGNMVIDGVNKVGSLFSMVKSTLPKESNSVIAFHDNSSAIYGFTVPYFHPIDPTKPSQMIVSSKVLHPILTAETHNFPCGIAPFPGAETGTGGRLRDVQATGRGAHTLAGVSAYCVGNLHIPSYPLPWELDVNTNIYPSNLAKPLTILIDASNGASDYGNKYGEPVILGFTRSFGQNLPNNDRVEYIKPIMFTAGVGLLNDSHKVKMDPENGMIVCKIGGPAYRIGMGGGAASSRLQGTADASLDFNAVQRGDAEMENRMNRVIRACIDLFERNPIISIHDQGAGGNGNVLKEIVDPLGATYDLRALPVGDPTMTVREIWGAEYQENNAFLIKPESLDTVLAVSKRENCPVSPVGVVTGDGIVMVNDRSNNSTPYNMPLSLVLGNMPKKTFTFTTPNKILKSISLPLDLTVYNVINRIFRLVDVGSKRFLTNKVDRSVTGLIAQQQCVGPLLTPLSNCAVTALSYYSNKGIALAVGEQPIKGLVNNAAQARMTVGEVLTNLVFAKITKISDIKMSGNWMWPAKMEGEGSKMWEACEALRDTLLALGPSIDGGKDSLSMAAKVEGQYVKSPGTLTLTAYAACQDITLTVTPDLKLINPDNLGVIGFIDISRGKSRCGGTALTTVFSQIGESTPDLDDTDYLKQVFHFVQELISERLISAGHDRSDGGIATAIIEMAIAGNCGIKVNIDSSSNNLGIIGDLFNEELGIILEFSLANQEKLLTISNKYSVDVKIIGTTLPASNSQIIISVDNHIVIDQPMKHLREIWESTSFELEKLQCNNDCVREEFISMNGDQSRGGPSYIITPEVYNVLSNYIYRFPSGNSPRIAVLRQEGSNGDREMLSAFNSAGCLAYDVNMNDLLDKSTGITLESFQGLVFCGGFSYADVNDSAKGWAGVIRFNPDLLEQFNWFKNQSNRFSLGVCNGCQLMALLGWIPFPQIYNTEDNNFTPESKQLVQELESLGWEEKHQPRFLHNRSGRFESRWSSVKIGTSPSVLLKGMEGSSLGVWVSHGEGQLYLPESKHLKIINDLNLAPIRYVDDNNEITMSYPLNPNGSTEGIAGLTSIDGRHLALMPHPERCYQLWQWPYKPVDTFPLVPISIVSDVKTDSVIYPSPW
eukprot:CAMPEP_0196763828 /NCGR_PEP_ID=MMETSP1095-20130614/4841_1 /TAXON_ID=96789 ORGANISM="Chromulina nebulosa, Strain UTEXLB2642" /NCGR_SAMPLE_ID=MMETSP1095 /ASSEMBLY_ACC=CAM_ASM_000446 /LENGTH=1200 /DNA_ID=CAMNT_0042117895 /DNA_START=396 /DNA_END=3995 /DNA_ORIENTATION=+